jgi:chemotaxis signal transduction protein
MDRYVLFVLNEDIYAVGVEHVLEICEITTMVKTYTDEINVINWHGTALPVLDPSAILTFSPHKVSVDSRVLVVQKEESKYGILVSEVIGVEEINKYRMSPPSMTDPRYIEGSYTEFKVLSPNEFVTAKTMENFKRIYKIPLQDLEQSDAVHGRKNSGKERIVENIQLLSLNWLLRASRANVEHEFLSDVLKIQHLIQKLK